jgi:hypothetical protein
LEREEEEALRARRAALDAARTRYLPYLTERVSKSQFPYKFVNLFFGFSIIKDKLTDLCGN